MITDLPAPGQNCGRQEPGRHTHGLHQNISGGCAWPRQPVVRGGIGGGVEGWIVRVEADQGKRDRNSETIDVKDPRGPRQVTRSRVFIPAKVWDNRILLARDPMYVANLHLVGSETLVRAWLDGDWSVVEGAYFDCWRADKHVIRPCELPDYWRRFRSMDWGSARPFSVGWWAIASDDFEHPDGPMIPRGALVRYREWYGSREPNVGLKLTAEEVARGIKERETQDESFAYSVADPSMFARDGGPSIAGRMAQEGKMHLRRADNCRVARRGAMGGWDQMRARLVGEDGRPMIYCFSTCQDSIRTIPALQHDETRPEDLDTESEDHAADEWRYACMSRPYAAPVPKKIKGIENRQPTFDELIAMQPVQSDDDGRRGRL